MEEKNNIQLRNTNAFLKGYTKKIARLTIYELKRDRKRTYINFNSVNTVNERIDSSGAAVDSIETIKEGNNHAVIGNDYLLDVDSGTASTIASVKDIIDWINVKPVRFKDANNNYIKLSSLKKESIATLIQAKLQITGMTPTNFLDDVMRNEKGKLDVLDEEVLKDVYKAMEDVFLNEGYIKKGNEFTITK